MGTLKISDMALQITHSENVLPVQKRKGNPSREPRRS